LSERVLLLDRLTQTIYFRFAVHPILFRIPVIELPIYSYGVMLGLSLVVGWYLVMYLGTKDGLAKDKMSACFIWTAVSAILGARVLYILTNLSEYQGEGLVDILNLRKGGLVAYGGFLGGFLGSWIYMRRQNIRLLAWADVVVPTLGTGLGITRLGCFMFGCDYGKPIPEGAPGWLRSIGVQFPNWEKAFPETAEMFRSGVGCMQGIFHGAPAFQHHVAMGLVNSEDAVSALVYPTQLMASANGWIAFALVMTVRRRLRFRGEAFLFFTAYYGFTRAAMEMLRGDTGRGSLGILSTSQFVGLSTFAISVIAWIVLSRMAKKNPDAAMFLGSGNPSPGAKTASKKRTERG
jgi:phosphatidylglycerol---prolipoprotein diacylglyceryl transferase